jgi:proline iminopeptidase
MRALIAISLCLLAATAARSQVDDPAATDSCVPFGIPVEDGYATSADGTRLHYRRLGTGTPVAIYLHGGPGATVYNGGCEIAAIARRHPIVLYDQRGGGRSDLVSDPQRLSWRHHVEDLEAVRRHVGTPRVALVGLSWGSALALLYADAHPERVTRLLLIAPMPVARSPFDEERNQAIERVAGADRLRARRELAQLMQTARADDEVVALCRRMMTETPLPYVVDPAHARRRTLTGCDYPAAVIRNRAIVARSTIQSLGDWDFRPALSRLRVPVLVVEGARTVVPLSSPRAWAHTAPQGRLLLVADAGHEVGVDRPKALRAAARTFLSGRYPRGAVRG